MTRSKTIIKLFSIVALLSASVSIHIADAKDNTTINPSETKTTQHKKPAPKDVLNVEALKSLQQATNQLDTETKRNLHLLSKSLHEQDRSIYNEIRDEEELSVTDIGMLWAAAVERSGTIRYAIEKLSRRDATGKPVEADNFSKRMLGSLVHLGGVAGSMWTGTPAGLIGSNMIQDIMSGNPQDSALSRVTDADMVLLAKNVEALQSQLIQLYFDYRHAKEKLALAQEAERTINQYYDQADQLKGNTADALRPLMQSLADSSKQDVQNALQGFNSSKSALSLLVGPEALAALDQQSAKKKA